MTLGNRTAIHNIPTDVTGLKNEVIAQKAHRYEYDHAIRNCGAKFVEVVTLAEYEAGKAVVAQSGCLACHKIGDNGNSGPGPDLTHIASRLPRQGIARTLVNPTAPMPSFKNLPPAKFKAVVNFLSQLK